MKTSRILVLVWCCLLLVPLCGGQEPSDVKKKNAAEGPPVRGEKALIDDVPATRKESPAINEPPSAKDVKPAVAQANDDTATHEQLRELRAALTDAVKKGDIEAQLAHVDKNVVATWQNNRVVRGPDGLRSFLKEMESANGKVFRGYKEEPTADELTILHGGDAGIVFGKSVPQYHYLGMDFELENRWTATLVKDDGKWKIAAYHVSANVMDNPILNIAKKSVYMTGAACLVVGIVLGAIVSSFLRKRAP